MGSRVCRLALGCCVDGGGGPSSIPCRSGSCCCSLLAFPNTNGAMVGLLFVAASASGPCCHCVSVDRQGQIVVHDDGAAIFRRATLVDVAASGAVSSTLVD